MVRPIVGAEVEGHAGGHQAGRCTAFSARAKPGLLADVVLALQVDHVQRPPPPATCQVRVRLEAATMNWRRNADGIQASPLGGTMADIVLLGRRLRRPLLQPQTIVRGGRYACVAPNWSSVGQSCLRAMPFRQRPVIITISARCRGAAASSAGVGGGRRSSRGIRSSLLLPLPDPLAQRCDPLRRGRWRGLRGRGAARARHGSVGCACRRRRCGSESQGGRGSTRSSRPSRGSHRRAGTRSTGRRRRGRRSDGPIARTARRPMLPPPERKSHSVGAHPLGAARLRYWRPAETEPRLRMPSCTEPRQGGGPPAASGRRGASARGCQPNSSLFGIRAASAAPHNIIRHPSRVGTPSSATSAAAGVSGLRLQFRPPRCGAPAALG